MIEVKLKGDLDCLAAFQELREHVRGNLFRTAVRSAAERMLAEIIARAPVLTGNLVSNLRALTSSARGVMRGRVVINSGGESKTGSRTDAFYWRFVEFGTRHAPAHPFVAPAFEAEREAAAQAVIDSFEDGLRRAEARAARSRVT